MKRLWMASVSLLAAFTVRGFAQDPLQFDPMPIVVAPGRAVVESQDKPAEKPKEGEKKAAEKPAETKPTAPVQAATNCNFDDNQSQKPSLIDTHTGPPDQIWLRMSYIYWHLKDMAIPQVLVAANGRTIIGDEKLDNNWFNGGKVEGGIWFGCDHTLGLEFGGFIFQRRGREVTAASSGNAGDLTISRPVIDALSNAPLDVIIAGPPQGNLAGTRGQITVSNSTRLTSAETSFVRNLAYNDCFQFDVFAGFRYLDLTDRIDIASNSDALIGTPFQINGSTASFNQLAISDSFHTRNQLYMGQIGTRIEMRRGMWFGGVRGSVAMGPNRQSSEIAGESIASTPIGGRAAASGGLLAVPNVQVNANPPFFAQGNAGQYKTDWFAIAPEVGLQVGAQLTRLVRVHVGYNFLYINNVVRPGDLIDTTVNRKFLPYSDAYRSSSGPDRPALRNNRDDFIAHGVEFGMQFQF